jgi:predicted nucleic acid-binding Zn ribbon protein
MRNVRRVPRRRGPRRRGGATTDVRHANYVEGLALCERCNEIYHRERDKRAKIALIVTIIIGVTVAACVVIAMTISPE